MVNAVAKPPKSAMKAPAARTPRNCKRLTMVAVNIPRGIAAPKWRKAVARTPSRPRLEECDDGIARLPWTRKVWLSAEHSYWIQPSEEQHHKDCCHNPQMRTSVSDAIRN